MIVDLSRKWLPLARCKGMDVEGFFAPHAANLKTPSRKLRKAWDEAKAVCAQCPVQHACARDHLGEIDGIWGGLDPLQRKELRWTHSQRIKRMDGPLKEEYARLAWSLHEQQYTVVDIARIIGIGRNTASYLCDWYREHLQGQDEPPPDTGGLTIENVSRAYGTTRNWKSPAPAG